MQMLIDLGGFDDNRAQLFFQHVIRFGEWNRDSYKMSRYVVFEWEHGGFWEEIEAGEIVDLVLAAVPD